MSGRLFKIGRLSLELEITNWDYGLMYIGPLICQNWNKYYTEQIQVQVGAENMSHIMDDWAIMEW